MMLHQNILTLTGQAGSRTLHMIMCDNDQVYCNHKLSAVQGVFSPDQLEIQAVAPVAASNAVPEDHAVADLADLALTVVANGTCWQHQRLWVSADSVDSVS